MNAPLTASADIEGRFPDQLRWPSESSPVASNDDVANARSYHQEDTQGQRDRALHNALNISDKNNVQRRQKVNPYVSAAQRIGTL
jgi:hypothetical protein